MIEVTADALVGTFEFEQLAEALLHERQSRRRGPPGKPSFIRTDRGFSSGMPPTAMVQAERPRFGLQR